MTIYMIDGFDLHADTSDNLPGAYDYSQYWYTPPFNSQTYVDGYLTGRALSHRLIPEFGMRGNTAGSTANAVPGNINELRICFWAKYEGIPGVALNYYGLCYQTWDGSNFGIQVTDDGTLRLAVDGFYKNDPDPTSQIIDTTSEKLEDDWNFYELYANIGTNTIEAYKDGVKIMSGSLNVVPTVGARPGLLLNRPAALNVDFDHIILTSGERPEAGRVHAVAPTVAQDRWNQIGGGLKGILIINGNSYVTLGNGVIVSSLSGFTSNNAANVVYYMFPTDPSTGAEWNASNFAQMQNWGVCGWNLDGTGGKVRVANLGLSVVETLSDPQGFPIIKVYAPGGATYYSGTWEKSDENLSFNAHLNDIPREDDGTPGDYLLIGDEGCLLFGYVNTVVDSVISTFGITFAEEFREDFYDWARVTVGGQNFSSYFVTGYSVLAGSDKDFQSNYVSVQYENVTEGGAYLQGVWDYTTTGDTGRWNNRQQVYAPKTGYKNQTRKLKVRGHGTALQIRVESQDQKDFRINGWAVFVTANQDV